MAADSTPSVGPLRRGRLIVIAAASGTGKTSLVKALMAARTALRFSVSYTTRAPRASEINGRDYHFVDAPTFERLIAFGELLEYARVFGHYYGTGARQVEEALEHGQDLVLEIDWQGAQQIRARLPEAMQIFILPPSRAALAQRLRERRSDTAEVIARRLEASAQEIAHWREFDYVIVNDEFERARADLLEIVDGRGRALGRDRPGLAEFAASLLDEARPETGVSA
jgi:guanylate kinase